MKTPLLSSFAAACTLATLATASPPVIDDQVLLADLRLATENSVEKEGIPTADSLSEMAKKSNQTKPRIPLPAAPGGESKNDYASLSRSVYVMNTVYKCGKCSHWHQGSTATAWCLGANGLMVTNAHVFINAKGGAMGIMDREGRFYPVTELLGSDTAADIAVFRVKGNGLQPLRLGAAAEVGSSVTTISNPLGNCFVRTAGSVSRYSKGNIDQKQPNVTWMAVTSDYAVGSSGGPVFNDAGEVVGMISNTISIYTDSQVGRHNDNPKGHFQMAIKRCVPVDSIRALFENAPKAD
jgi:serine protease Do